MLGLTSLIALWIPKILAQIGLFVATEKVCCDRTFSLCHCLCSSLLYSVATYFLGLLLDCVMTYFDNVTT